MRDVDRGALGEDSLCGGYLRRDGVGGRVGSKMGDEIDTGFYYD